MYTYSEVEKIFNSCNNWIELQQVASSFEFLFDEGWIKSKTLYDEIIKLCDNAFRRIENLG